MKKISLFVFAALLLTHSLFVKAQSASNAHQKKPGLLKNMQEESAASIEATNIYRKLLSTKNIVYTDLVRFKMSFEDEFSADKYQSYVSFKADESKSGGY